MSLRSWLLSGLAVVLLCPLGCSSSRRPPAEDGDADADADTDVDTDVDTDSDSDHGDPICGDGITVAPEVCDDGNLEWEAVGENRCSPDCQSDERCGNLYIDWGIGEQCDDGDGLAGDGCSADCRSSEVCGNGVPDEGETCDDGNRVAGDGCSPDCLSDERCGNGITDWGAGELCDDDERCIGCAMLAGCGDLALDEGESCDDGNTDAHDGCSPLCTTEQSVVTSMLRLAGAGEGCDLDGDGAVDNAFSGGLGDAGGYLDDSLDLAIQEGSLILLMDFLGLDDPSGQEDGDVYVGVYQGADGDLGYPNPNNNFDGGASFFVAAASLTDEGAARGALAGGIFGGTLDAGPEDIEFAFPFGDVRVVFALGQATAFGTMVPMERDEKIEGIDAGLLCGSLPAGPMKAVPIDFGFPIGPPTLLDLLVVGFDFLIEVTPTQPDLDLDYDGLETFADEDGDGEIDACYDGDGTHLPGAEGCVFDPEIQDGYSSAFAYRAVWSRIVGVR